MMPSGAFNTTEYAAHHLTSQSQPSQAMPFAAFAAPVICSIALAGPVQCCLSAASKASGAVLMDLNLAIYDLCAV